MSFFLGKDPSDKPVLHMTSETRSAEDLKSGEYADTIFHSSRENIRYRAYNNVPFSHIAAGDVGYYDIYSFPSPPLSTYTPTRLSVPSPVLAYAEQGKGILLRVHTTNYSFVAVPFISFADPFTSYYPSYRSQRYLDGSVAWYNTARLPTEPTFIFPAPIQGNGATEIVTMLPKDILVSVDVLVLDWGSGYIFSPDKPSEIWVIDKDILLGGTADANRLSRYQYIRISGNTRIDLDNTHMGIFDINGQKWIGWMEFMNDPIPTGSELVIRPDRLVVKGRTQVDKSKATKTSRYKAAGSVLIPNTDTGTTNSEAITEVVIRPQNTYKSTDLIHIYLGPPGATEGEKPVGSYGPFLMGDTKRVDEHRSYGFAGGTVYETAYMISVGPRPNGDYVVKVIARAPVAGTGLFVHGVRLSYLIFPEA